MLPASHPADVIADARTALACLDLTSLNDDDMPATIDALCGAALGTARLGHTPAAVCVWPRFVAQARAALPAAVRVAAVANFPAGVLDVDGALRDTVAIVDAGGNEVDLVLPWRALMQAQSHGDRRTVAALVAAVRRACPGHGLKLIIESGELKDETLIRTACQLGLDEGVDFLKTSTGKTPTGATLDAARVMLQAIAAQPRAVGFKASGGIRTVRDAQGYIALQRELLGDKACVPARLRFGASSLLADIVAVLEGRAAPGATAPSAY